MVTVKLYGVSAVVIDVIGFGITLAPQAAYSTCTRRVLTTANEIGVTVELVPVDLSKGEHKTEEYLSTKQPFGVIPVLEVSILYAICRTVLTHALRTKTAP